MTLLSAGNSAPAMSVTGLTVTYGDTPVLRDLDLIVPQGAMMAVIGPNGAGKSTLIKAAMGLVPRLSGSVVFDGQPLKAARARIAYVPQRASVDWEFPATVMDVVLMGFYRELGLLRVTTARHRARATACLARVGMAEFASRQIGQLSGGQQQRVFLARALAQEATLYILDEPFAGVDAATERAIIDVLKSLNAEGATILAVHHDLATVRDYFDHVVLVNGTALAQGPLDAAFTAAALQRAYGGRLSASQMEIATRAPSQDNPSVVATHDASQDALAAVAPRAASQDAAAVMSIPAASEGVPAVMSAPALSQDVAAGLATPAVSQNAVAAVATRAASQDDPAVTAARDALARQPHGY